MTDSAETVRPGTCVWKMRNGRGCGRDAVRFLRVVPGERRWFLCGIHARLAAPIDGSARAGQGRSSEGAE